VHVVHVAPSPSSPASPTGFIAAASTAYATVEAPTDPAAAPVAPSTGAARLPLWQLLAFVALGVLLAVAIVGLGYSLSHSRRSESSQPPNA